MTMLGKHHSEKTKRKLSIAVSLTMTPERRKQISESQIGREQSKESRIKRSVKLKGRIFTDEHREKLSINNCMLGKFNDINPNWRGDNISYDNIHKWVSRELGKPDKCEYCGKDNLSGHQVHWSSKDHLYKRDLTNWARLCVSCHRLYDNGKIKI